MRIFYSFVIKFYTACSKVWNSQYYLYENISSEAVFAAAFPGFVRIVNPNNCRIGRGSVINANSVLHCAGKITIGDFVHIGHGLSIYSSNHDYRSENCIPYDADDIVGDVRIGDCVWIGANASIVPGISIDEGAVIGMGSVVTRDVACGSIVCGNPAKVVGHRDMKSYWRLKEEGKFQ